MNDWIRQQRKLVALANPTVNNQPLEYAFRPFSEREYICANCRERKDGTQFALFDDPKRLHSWCKDCRLKYPYPVPDYYVRRLLRQRTHIAANSIPATLIELKRKTLQLRRLRKNHEDHQRHSRTVHSGN